MTEAFNLRKSMFDTHRSLSATKNASTRPATAVRVNRQSSQVGSHNKLTAAGAILTAVGAGLSQTAPSPQTKILGGVVSAAGLGVTAAGAWQDEQARKAEKARRKERAIAVREAFERHNRGESMEYGDRFGGRDSRGNEPAHHDAFGGVNA